MNNDLSIHSLHNDVLRKLPFSVSGNASIERTVFRFLQQVSESPFVASNRQITFLMGGFAKISLVDLSELFQHKWETERLRNFFYYDYEDDFVEPILSLYRYCLEELTATDVDGITKFKNVTNIICDNNHAGVNFRVRINPNDKSTKIKITHIRRERVLEAQIPTGLYKEFDRFTLLDSFDTAYTGVERSSLNPHQYFNSEDFEKIDKSLYESIVGQIFNEGVPTKFKEGFADFVLNTSENEKRLKVPVLKNEQAELKEIYYLFYTAGLLAYLLDCDIEYFTSVSNNIGVKKYSLGSIAVGYKRTHEGRLSGEVRAFFNIVSNHIAQNLATQILLDSSRMQQYISKRKSQAKFIEDFAAHVGHENYLDSHCDRVVAALNKKNPLQSNTDGKITLNGRTYDTSEIESSFGQGFVDYLNANLQKEFFDYGFFHGFHESQSCLKTLNKFYEKFHNCDCYQCAITLSYKQIDPTAYNGDKTIDKPSANVFLPHKLIDLIETDRKRPVCSITTFTHGSAALIVVEYQSELDIMGLIKSLDTFSDDESAETEDSKGGSFHKFIRDHYDAFRICGDLVIHGMSDVFDIPDFYSLLSSNSGKQLSELIEATFAISFKKDFKSESDENGKIKFTFVGNPNPIVGVKKLVLEIKYNLF